MIVGVACMQLVEKGTLALDDSDQLEKLLPELKDVKVLQDDGTLVPKNKGITLRMLLTHTGMNIFSSVLATTQDLFLTQSKNQPDSGTRSSTKNSAIIVIPSVMMSSLEPSMICCNR